MFELNVWVEGVARCTDPKGIGSHSSGLPTECPPPDGHPLEKRPRIRRVITTPEQSSRLKSTMTFVGEARACAFYNRDSEVFHFCRIPRGAAPPSPTTTWRCSDALSFAISFFSCCFPFLCERSIAFITDQLFGLDAFFVGTYGGHPHVRLLVCPFSSTVVPMLTKLGEITKSRGTGTLNVILKYFSLLVPLP